jgi:hypothetical protein
LIYPGIGNDVWGKASGSQKLAILHQLGAVNVHVHAYKYLLSIIINNAME